MYYLLSCSIGYLLGSIPTAYILLKKTHNIDVTAAGSGNAGAMNSFELSNSKIIGLLVFVIDALKGLLSVYLCLLLFPIDFIYPALAVFFAVLSHCYNPWLKFKGGRGLATAAGGAALLSPLILAAWCILWVIVYIFKKNILLSNISALVLTFLLIVFSVDIIDKFTFPAADSYSLLIMFSAAFLSVIFTKHIDPLREIINNFISKEKR